MTTPSAGAGSAHEGLVAPSPVEASAGAAAPRLHVGGHHRREVGSAGGGSGRVGGGRRLAQHLRRRRLPALPHLGVRVRDKLEQPSPELGCVGRSGRQAEQQPACAQEGRPHDLRLIDVQVGHGHDHTRHARALGREQRRGHRGEGALQQSQHATSGRRLRVRRLECHHQHAHVGDLQCERARGSAGIRGCSAVRYAGAAARQPATHAPAKAAASETRASRRLPIAPHFPAHTYCRRPRARGCRQTSMRSPQPWLGGDVAGGAGEVNL
eukprot:scaffold2753_cov115-Isochrysis_galbana.AAC.4